MINYGGINLYIVRYFNYDFLHGKIFLDLGTTFDF